VRSADGRYSGGWRRLAIVSTTVLGSERIFDMSARDKITELERKLEGVAALLPKSQPGGPKLCSPYTVSEAVQLDEIEKKAAAKASSVSVCFFTKLCAHRDRSFTEKCSVD